MDWALAEALAIGSLMYEGVNVRLTGQDTRRGTFSHRHSVLVDYTNAQEYVPLPHIRDGLSRVGAAQLIPASAMGNFTVRDSLLSEYAAVGFEYGYSVEAPEALVAWEAQFGDFANGAEMIIDNFLAAAEIKWGQYSGLVMLLPHGYEGQGPEHSSSRFERFLSLSARGNMRVTIPSTSASTSTCYVRRPGGTQAPAHCRHTQVDAAGPRLAVDAGRTRDWGVPPRHRRQGCKIPNQCSGSFCAAGRSPTRP